MVQTRNWLDLRDDPPPPPTIVHPSIEGFTAWVFRVMGVPTGALAPDTPYLQLAYDEALNVAYVGLAWVPNWSIANPKSPSIYAIAVYNLGGHILASIAVDDPDAVPPTTPPTFWADLRDKLQMNSLSIGFVTSASDQGTSAGQQIPNAIADMTLMGLDLMKTPWGRRYMTIAGQWGNLWGIS